MSSIGQQRSKSRVDFVRAKGLEPEPSSQRASRWTLPRAMMPAASLPVVLPVGKWLYRRHPDWPWATISTVVIVGVMVALTVAAIALWQHAQRQVRLTLSGDGDPR